MLVSALELVPSVGRAVREGERRLLRVALGQRAERASLLAGFQCDPTALAARTRAAREMGIALVAEALR